MQVDDFDFDLPESLIALRPAQPRDTARLLHIPAAADRADKSVRDLPRLLRAGDALVVNTTKVIPARLIGTRLRTGGEGAKIEITLTERLGPVDWRCFMKPAKKVKDGDIIDFNGVSAVVSGRKEGQARLVFDLPPDAMETSLAELGTMPLPPYIAGKRPPDAQ
ncbi:MAG: tRNA preQ1(34) S-adenosylmethionine ribosyltransferase-isomerase QueA, partial [Alphaproteobacteria bacterium]|nr:tRNA preQ1(34) S-adenosylmethionine ribosyltransferase-isomerase QueA [Alphaproteobacteria bacterium]